MQVDTPDSERNPQVVSSLPQDTVLSSPFVRRDSSNNSATTPQSLPPHDISTPPSDSTSTIVVENDNCGELVPRPGVNGSLSNPQVVVPFGGSNDPSVVVHPHDDSIVQDAPAQESQPRPTVDIILVASAVIHERSASDLHVSLKSANQVSQAPTRSPGSPDTSPAQVHPADNPEPSGDTLGPSIALTPSTTPENVPQDSVAAASLSHDTSSQDPTGPINTSTHDSIHTTLDGDEGVLSQTLAKGKGSIQPDSPSIRSTASDITTVTPHIVETGNPDQGTQDSTRVVSSHERSTHVDAALPPTYPVQSGSHIGVSNNINQDDAAKHTADSSASPRSEKSQVDDAMASLVLVDKHQEVSSHRTPETSGEVDDAAGVNGRRPSPQPDNAGATPSSNAATRTATQGDHREGPSTQPVKAQDHPAQSPSIGTVDSASPNGLQSASQPTNASAAPSRATVQPAQSDNGEGPSTQPVKSQGNAAQSSSKDTTNLASGSSHAEADNNSSKAVEEDTSNASQEASQASPIRGSHVFVYDNAI